MKWIIGLVGAVIVLVLLAIVVIPMVVDPNDFKPQIVAAAKEATGRELAIRDDMELSVFPNLALRLGGVSLSNAKGFAEPEMAAIEELDLRVALMPLLSRSLEVDKVVVRGLHLNLGVQKDGRTNWDDLIKNGKTETAEAPSGDGTGAGDIAIAVEGIEVSDAQLVWDDRRGGKRYELAGLDFTTGRIATDQAVPLTLAFTLNSSAPAQTFEVEIAASVTADRALQRIDVADFVVALTAAGEGLPAGGLDLGLKAGIALDQAAGTLAITGIAATGPDLELTGTLNGTGLGGKPAFSGEFELAESNPKQLMALGGTAPETADPAALTRVSAKFGVQATATSAALKPFSVTLDDSTFSGDFSIKSFEGPALRFALNLDQIDIDRYLPPKSEEVAEAESGPAAEDPLAALRPLDLAGTIAVGSLKVANLTTSNINVTVKSQGGVLNLNPIAAALYEGKVSGNIQVDASKAEPRITIENKLSGIRISPLLKDFTGSDKLAGSGNVGVSLKMRGLTPEPIKRSLNGNVAVSLSDGVYKGIDVIKTICSVGTKFDQLLEGATGELNQSGDTAFSALSASVVFTDGVARSDDLDLKSPLLRVNGAGGANLVEETIDYLVEAELVSACEGQSGAAADQLVGVPLPIRARGTFSEPKIAPDWAALGQELAKSGIKDKAETLIKDKLKLPGVGGTTGEAAGEAAGDGPAGAVGGALEGLKKLF